MATITVTPMSQGIDRRAETPVGWNLRNAYALEEYRRSTTFEPGQVGLAFDRALKEMILSPYMRERGFGREDEINVVVTIRF